MRYETQRDVELRLRHSVVMHKSQPVVVMDVRDENTLLVQYILSGDHDVVPLQELDLAPSSAPLGYVLADEDVYLAMRKPVRKFKQGLTQDNLLVRPVLQKRAEMAPRRLLSYTSPHLAKTMVNDFPSVEKAFQAVRNGRSRIMPFSRDWAVADHDDDLCLAFRGEVVGFVGDNNVKLLPERFYLKESLEACLK